MKRPVSAYIQFSINRQNSGDFKNIAIAQRAKLIGQEWKALSESDKKVGLILSFDDRVPMMLTRNVEIQRSPIRGPQSIHQ